MDKDQQQEPKDKKDRNEPNVLPATEIPKNPNPRANENLTDEVRQSGSGNKSGVGSEITDGEGG